MKYLTAGLLLPGYYSYRAISDKKETGSLRFFILCAPKSGGEDSSHDGTYNLGLKYLMTRPRPNKSSIGEKRRNKLLTLLESPPQDSIGGDFIIDTQRKLRVFTMDSSTFKYHNGPKNISDAFEDALHQLYNNGVLVSLENMVFNPVFKQNNSINRKDFFSLQNEAGKMSMSLYKEFRSSYNIDYNLVIIGNIPKKSFDDCKPFYIFSYIPEMSIESQLHHEFKGLFSYLPLDSAKNDLLTSTINEKFREKSLNKYIRNKYIYSSTNTPPTTTKYWSVIQFLKDQYGTIEPIWSNNEPATFWKSYSCIIDKLIVEKMQNKEPNIEYLIVYISGKDINLHMHLYRNIKHQYEAKNIIFYEQTFKKIDNQFIYKNEIQGLYYYNYIRTIKNKQQGDKITNLDGFFQVLLPKVNNI